MGKKLTTETFIEKARKIHGDTYNYSKVNYVNNSTKVCIICPIHGEFWQRPDSHLRGQGCPTCGGTKKITTDDFIKKARNVHGDKYDYSKMSYVNNATKICIICPEHGEFWQTPDYHLKSYGCPKCGINTRAKNNTKTTEQFIKEARQIHGWKYDYCKVQYIGKDKKVCIICPEHGEFWQTPHNHLHGAGCPDCKKEYFSKLYKDTTETFIKKARMVHGDKYNYSKVEYIDSHTPVCIICNEHGEFWQRPNNHLHGWGCSKCSSESTHEKQKLTLSGFIKKARMVHSDKYDYSKTNYTDSKTKVCIVCPEHGEFWQTPNNHLHGWGCPKCSGIYLHNTEEFIEKARKIHGDRYDYSKVEYRNNHTKVCIICPEHGEFWQKPNAHLNGNGCPYCSNRFIKTTEQFIDDAHKIHGDKYDYSKVKYITSKTKVCIICPEHGEFWQAPNNHLLGQGCPKCKETKLELAVENILRETNITYIYQYTGNIGNKHLGKKSIDFYLPNYGIAIECQGEQHFTAKDFFGGTKTFKEQVRRDIEKLRTCIENNTKMIYFTNQEFINKYGLKNTSEYTYVTNKSELISYINKNKK